MYEILIRIADVILSLICMPSTIPSFLELGHGGRSLCEGRKLIIVCNVIMVVMVKTESMGMRCIIVHPPSSKPVT